MPTELRGQRNHRGWFGYNEKDGKEAKEPKEQQLYIVCPYGLSKKEQISHLPLNETVRTDFFGKEFQTLHQSTILKSLRCSAVSAILQS